jgi:Tripartite tricarboxylate transporter family receptor
MGTKALAAVATTWVAAIASSGAAMAQAESYPDRPIHFVAPYNPGGTVDPTARVLGEAVAKILGQPVVIENRAGAAGSVGTDYASAGPCGAGPLSFPARRCLSPRPQGHHRRMVGGEAGRCERSERRATGRMPATAGTAKSPGCRSPASARRC